jgi:ankyrin repeat protein
MVLIKAGADINAKNNYGITPLMEAARNHNQEAIIMLLELGADPKAKNNFGIMAIDYAKRNAKLKNTEALWILQNATDEAFSDVPRNTGSDNSSYQYQCDF